MGKTLKEMEKELIEKPLTKKQKQYLEILKNKAGNISVACEKSGIQRQTHYDWMNTNLTLKKAVEDIHESLLDFAESKLMSNIKDGKETSLIFYLKTRGKSRGYIERQELDVSGDPLINKIEIEVVKK